MVRITSLDGVLVLGTVKKQQMYSKLEASGLVIKMLCFKIRLYACGGVFNS